MERTTLLTTITDRLEQERDTVLLIAIGVALAAAYVLLTFDIRFLAGLGPFWANPRGPWLMDPNDSIDSADILQMQVGYTAFLHAPWGLPLFFVPDLGTPTGTSVILLDVIPIVALAGKLFTTATGIAVNPYGVWVAACFILSAVFAVLLMIQLGQRSLLAAAGASVLAISMPALLHRFGHISLLGQFIIIGALWLYSRDPHWGDVRRRQAWWAGWLCLAIMVHAYLFAMAAAVYAATVLRRINTQRLSPGRALQEPVLTACCVAAVMAAAGYFGKGTGTSASGGGYGYYSMNLLSPLWPQRSGLFPGFYSLVTGTNGQYEGFNYLGAGVLLLVAVTVQVSWGSLRPLLHRHLTLAVVLLYLTLFAISNVWFLGTHQVFYMPLPKALDFVAGIFRSSGRMFWPCAYAVALFSLALALRRLKPGWKTLAVLGCCLLQLIDSNPLRARITTLTQRDVPSQLNRPQWAARMLAAQRVHVEPSFMCSNLDSHVEQLELQSAAVNARRPTNAVYNPRLQENCAENTRAAMRGPWEDSTLYVFFQTKGDNGLPATWRPPGLACQLFEGGFWCLGHAPEK